MRHNNKLVTVYAKDGVYVIKTPNGELMPCLQWIRVSDNWPNQPYLIARMDCNIANNNENFDEPIKLYNQNEVDLLNQKNAALRLEIKDLHGDMDSMKSLEMHASYKLNKIQSKWWYPIIAWYYNYKF